MPYNLNTAHNEPHNHDKTLQALKNIKPGEVVIYHISDTYRNEHAFCTVSKGYEEGHLVPVTQRICRTTGTPETYVGRLAHLAIGI
jgi:hypothetical protein